MREPNQEQKLAISQDGGVLLQAGAGSGKTFVIVEHLLYKLRSFVTSLNDLTTVESEITDFASKIVIMTFTRKAAGELKNRIRNRIQALEEGEQKLFSKALETLTVTTIHGFCMRLIQQYGFEDLSHNVELVSGEVIDEKIADLLNEWMEHGESEVSPQVFSSILSHSHQVVSAFSSVFNDPELRFKWSHLSSLNREKKEDTDLFQNFLSAFKVTNSFSHLFSLLSAPEVKGKKFGDLLLLLSPLLENGGVKSFENLMKVYSVIDDFGRLPPFPKKFKGESSEDEWLELKSLRETVKKNHESFTSVLNSKEELSDWSSAYLGLFTFMEERYQKDKKISFSDLEYFTYKELQDEKRSQHIQDGVDYLIVDEFQDTSNIQFEIISSLAGPKLEKLFAVGDPKQAIYGFRGGELSVYEKCKELIPHVLNLGKNYRSAGAITRFNNAFFSEVLNRGEGYHGEDFNKVPFDAQDVPDVKDSLNGEIHSKEMNLSQEKLSSGEYYKIEAESICEMIEEQIKDGAEDICVLYKNLRPSRELILELLNKKIAFTSQVKIPNAENPIWITLLYLVEYSLATKEEDRDYICFNMSGVLSFLGVKECQNLKILFLEFENESRTMGTLLALAAFLQKIGLSSGLFTEDYKEVGRIVESAQEKFEIIKDKVQSKLDNLGSVEIQFGDGDSRVKIMSAHASKGLEFDHVILGGVASNGRKPVDSPFIGKHIGSFKFKPEGSSNPIPTIEMIVEKKEKENKEFSESKRLFYVAATRAVNSLSWVLPPKQLRVPKNSWSQALIEAKNIINIKTTSQEITDEAVLTSVDKPLFHLNNLGFDSRERSGILAITADLSVTKLTSLVQCPRKFYLKNILRLEGEGQQSIQKVDNAPAISSKERGTEIHLLIENMLRSNFVLPLNIPDREHEKLIWVRDYLREEAKDCELLIEEEMKFSLLGQMINGIPDLIVYNLEQNLLKIVDFKTGRLKEEENLNYWFQLYSYAVGFKQIHGNVPDSIDLILCYVDEKQAITRTMGLEEIENLILSQWEKLKDLTQINLNHCSQCTYGNICH